MTDPVTSKRRAPALGRGLSALLGDTAVDRGPANDGVREIAIADISADPDQPRRFFDSESIDELAASIAARGVLQPIVVRPFGDKYRIVAGERRWRAAQRAHLHQIPAIIRDFDDAITLEVALIENIQRASLNAIEEGEAYKRLIEQYGHSQDTLGKIVHKSRSHVANLMRLLDLPFPVRSMVADGRLSMGHARALLGADDAVRLAQEVIEKNLSVRDVERLVKRAKRSAPIEYKSMSGPVPDSDIGMLERQLGDLLGLNVTISHKSGAGSVTLHYATLDQLDMICQRLSGEKI